MKKSSLSERDIDRLLSGRTAAGGEEQLAAFFHSARVVLSLPPDEKTERDHLRAMLAAARPRPATTILPTTTRGTSRTRGHLGLRLRAAAAKVAIGALGLTTGTAGLAMAGVDLPGTVAEKAFGAVGVALPNQGQGGAAPNASETSRRVREAIQGRDGSMSGCEFGASVSRAARGVVDESDPEHCNPPGHDKARKGEHGSGRGPKKQPPGQTKDQARGNDSDPETGVAPPGKDGTKGKPDTPPGLTTKEEKAKEPPVTPPARETNPGNGTTPREETGKPEVSGAPPIEVPVKPTKDVSSSTEG
jgi:hypothetical protein